MHLGNARTALLAWLQARAAGGRILLRIEDLDPQRSRREAEASIRADLAWLGLDWDDEQPRQSTRTASYAAAVERLDAAGLLYECFCTRAELRSAAEAPHGPGDDPPRYPGTCRGLSAGERARRRAEGRRAALRLRMPPGVVAFDDVIHGTVRQDVAATVGDLVVRRADGVHAYQLAVVVDDAAGSVTHVLRGDDLLGSTPRQIVLGRLLGLPTPTYAHVPLLLGHDGARLSKRHGAPGIVELRAAGVPPDVVVGSLAAGAGLVPEGTSCPPAALVADFAPARIGRRPVRLGVPGAGDPPR